ncbi:MAG: ABC transporter permease, partial [Actinobacteria bacterium]|nr:ABC transporter permease [Actinomycetota bacterium]
ANSKNAAAWAYVLAACLLGLLFFAISVVLESAASKRGGAVSTGK